MCLYAIIYMRLYYNISAVKITDQSRLCTASTIQLILSNQGKTLVK